MIPRIFQLGAPITIFSLLLVSCKRPAVPQAGGAVAILVDRTLSVSKHGLTDYSSYFNNHVIFSLHPGERVLIETISDQVTLSDPPLRAVDTKLPSINAPDWTFNDDYMSYGRKCRSSVTMQFPAFDSAMKEIRRLSAPAFARDNLASTSFILDGIEGVSEFLSHQSGPRVLVLFSDGIEDSVEYNATLKFDGPNFWDRVSPSKLIAQLVSQHRVPNLKGTEVYFVGAAARHPEQFRSIKIFWEAYFQASGVELKQLHYGLQPTWEQATTPTTQQEVEAALCKSGSF